MDSISLIQKMRDERMAREKARIEKLREMNLKKYSTCDQPSEPTRRDTHSSIKTKPINSMINLQTRTDKDHISKNIEMIRKFTKSTEKMVNKTADIKKQPSDGTRNPKVTKNDVKPRYMESARKITTNYVRSNISSAFNGSKQHNNLNGTSSAFNGSKQHNNLNGTSSTFNGSKQHNLNSTSSTFNGSKQHNLNSTSSTQQNGFHTASKVDNIDVKNPINFTQKFSSKQLHGTPSRQISSRKTAPSQPRKVAEPRVSRLSVFERLYQPKKRFDLPAGAVATEGAMVGRKSEGFTGRIRTGVTASGMRRSISAVHLKKIGRDQLKYCVIKRASSLGEGLNELEELNEDDMTSVDVDATECGGVDKKSVKFMTPSRLPPSLMTEDMKLKLSGWLAEQGKSEVFRSLQDFGARLAVDTCDFECQFTGVSPAPVVTTTATPSVAEPLDESNKENVEQTEDDNKRSRFEFERWRRASGGVLSELDSTTATDVLNTTGGGDTTAAGGTRCTDDMMLPALNDLLQLIHEDFEWYQCARWLRALRERYPQCIDTHVYWECRAALEARQGNLPRSCQCWEKAIVKGTKPSVVDASLDQLLDKFMRLNIETDRATSVVENNKMVDIKNVFKSTLIKFAVHKAKIENDQSVKLLATPVRRSSRLQRTPFSVGRRSAASSRRSQLVDVCDTLINRTDEVQFIRNGNIVLSP